MALDRAVDSARLNGAMTATADAIREKTGGSDAIAWDGEKGFAEAVKELDTFQAPDSLVLDPDEVYRTTRPKDWLAMPVPGDDEMYLLGMIRDGGSGWFAATIRYTGSCIVEFGTLKNGVFEAKESLTPTSGTAFTKQLFSADYGDLTSDGYRQYMVRISGGVTDYDGRRTARSTPPIEIADIACGIALSGCRFGDYDYAWKCMNQLRYLRFTGKGNPGWINASFVGGCESVLAVACETEGTSDYAAYTCFGCYSLIAISSKLFKNAVNSLDQTFRESAIADIRLGMSPTSLIGTFFATCLKIYTPDVCGTEKATSINSMFYRCRTLCSVDGLNLSATLNLSDVFFQCYSLTHLTFAGETTPGGWTIDLTYTSLGHEALVRMIESLPAATKAAAIRITNNPGAPELTDDEIAIATAKNWTVTI